ncbi:PREDICTED: uncharacterized protein LOC109323679 isoform X1 [Crocodylus porosus]|uniref:uncharacterized protein LOC109323679 isoform X1 n=1 Tax=Crocodylus porosus TaxID=8502 RepID=UPI00093E4C6E|nr:PREDICTED: uncharacterized protein LOC109323679 isoform X1 [Crocodylus porosus]XP_019410911.1 PREDICTED: uncharacterized protein LOC109323679 isoform X1 [Crocodylus porosus]
MILRSGFQVPYEKSQKRPRKKKEKIKARIKFHQQTQSETCTYRNKSPAYKLRERKKCYIQTEDSKTVHFDLDEHGHREISVKDTASDEDIAWLDIFTSTEQDTIHENGAKKHCNDLVTMTQRSKCNHFLLLSENEKQLDLKVLNSQPIGLSMAVCSNEEYPDLQQLTEMSQENQLFIMHMNPGNSVKFQCYQDKNYFLHVNKDSIDVCKFEETEADAGKDFHFKVEYVENEKANRTKQC